MIVKQPLREEKSVNSSIAQCSMMIGRAILNDSSSQKRAISLITKTPYITNTIDIDVSAYLPHLHTLSVTYYLYYCQTLDHYNMISTQGDFENDNAESDYRQKTLKVISCFISNRPLYDLETTIFHEITHLFQYEQGMAKRVDLYDKVVEAINNSKDEAKRLTALCLYYSFKHEQDAFAHQFYSFLTQTQPNQTFEELLNYSEYRNFSYFYEQWNAYSDKNKLGAACRWFGYFPNNLFKRLHFAKKRLRRKLHNAFQKYLLDKRSMSESLFLDSLLESKYNLHIQLEEFYNFKILLH